MPPRLFPKAATTGRHRRSALLTLTLAGVVTTLFAAGVSQAVAGDDQGAGSKPSNVRVLSATQSSVTLVWDASADNLEVEGYKIWYGDAPPDRVVEPVVVLEPKFTITGLSCGQSVKVEIRAFDHAGSVSRAAKAVVSTAPCFDSQSPSAPTELRQTSNSSTAVTLAWSPSTDNVGVAGYVLSQDGLELGTTSQTAYTFTGLACGKTHALAVRAYDAGWNYSKWASFYATTSSCGDVSAPSAPRSLAQTSNTATAMTVAWSASTDNFGVARYDVFHDGELTGSTSSLSYSLSGLTCGTSYTIGVEAVDGAGNHSNRTSATMSTSSCAPPTNDTQPPTTPVGVALSGASGTTLTLAWLPSIDNVGVKDYGVVRNGQPVQRVSDTSFVFLGLSCATSYELGVVAYDASGNHSGPATVIASTTSCYDGDSGGGSGGPTAPTNVILLDRTSASVTISWSASTDDVGVVGYGAYVDGYLDGSTLTTTYTFTNLPCNTTKVFSIDAYDSAGNRSTKANVAFSTTACDDTQPPTAPGQVVVSGETQTSMALSWSASSDNYGVAGYDVFVNGTKNVTVTGTSYTLNGLACGASYTVGVEAFDAAGNRSSRTAVASSTTVCAPPLSSGSVFVSLNGSDSNLCSATSPCKSFNRAYQVAALGATVLVAPGDYPSQTIVDTPGKDTTGDAPDVQFMPASGPVRVQNLRLGDSVEDNRGPDHITIRGITGTPGAELFIGGNDANDITVDGFSGRSFYVNGAQRTTITRGVFGPGVAPDTPNSKVDRNVTNEDISIVDNTIREYSFGPSCIGYGGTYDCHGEGLFILGGKNIRVERNRFYSNWTYSVFVQYSSAAYPQFSLTVCNNWFGSTSDGNGKTRVTALDFGTTDLANVNVCHNSFAPGQRLANDIAGAKFTNINVWGNIFGTAADCIPGLNYTFNVWTSGSCGTSDRAVSTLPYVNASGGADQDYHLRPGTLATDLVPAAAGVYSVSEDIDGQSRPMGSGRDAGADEAS